VILWKNKVLANRQLDRKVTPGRVTTRGKLPGTIALDVVALYGLCAYGSRQNVTA